MWMPIFRVRQLSSDWLARNAEHASISSDAPVRRICALLIELPGAG